MEFRDYLHFVKLIVTQRTEILFIINKKLFRKGTFTRLNDFPFARLSDYLIIHAIVQHPSRIRERRAIAFMTSDRDKPRLRLFGVARNVLEIVCKIVEMGNRYRARGRD